MGVIRVGKRILKAVTTPHMRDIIKQWLFKGYMVSFHFSRRERTVAPFGVNLIGHIRGDFGLGESCRLVAGSIYYSGIPVAVINVPQNGSAVETNLEWTKLEQDAYLYGINIIHLNPPELSNSLWKLNPSSVRSRYNIAFWLWELPEFPPEWKYTFQMFDEIWTPAEFVSASIRRMTDKPVYTMPYGLPQPKTDPVYDRKYFGLPEEDFLFLVSYDGNSVSARKNPIGAIRAYKAAFPPGSSGMGIVIKATHEKSEYLRELTEELRDCGSLTVLTDSYDKTAFNSLIRCVDVYVSLHRAEGFGLVMAEAMMLGTPVIATNWSANTEFMDEKTACLVDAALVEIEKEIPPYHKGNHWAKPDEKQASELMLRLYEDTEFRKTITQNAIARLTEDYSVQRAAQRMSERLEQIKSGNHRQTGTSTDAPML